MFESNVDGSPIGIYVTETHRWLGKPDFESDVRELSVALDEAWIVTNEKYGVIG